MMEGVGSSSHPCPHCGEPISIKAGWCPYCHGRALVDLLTAFELPDPRGAYFAARELLEVPGQPHSFSVLKSRLDEAPGLLVVSVPRSVALACAEKLEALGIKSLLAHRPEIVVEAPAEEPRDRTPPLRAALATALRHPGISLAVLVGIGLLSVAVASRDGAPTAGTPVRSAPISAPELGALINRSTVNLSCRDHRDTGVFIAPDLVLTSETVVCPESPGIDVLFRDGTRTGGSVFRLDERLDLSLVRLAAAGGMPLAPADATRLSRGDAVYFMDARSGSFTDGVISLPERPVLGVSYLQFMAGPPSDGGPLLDEFGNLVGVVSTILEPEDNLHLALPVNYLTSGPNPLLPGVTFDFDSEKWQARIEGAELSDRNLIAANGPDLKHPAVLAARWVGGGKVAVQVARWSTLPPFEESLSWVVRRAGRDLCSPPWTTVRWKLSGERAVANPGARFTQWLTHHDRLDELYVSNLTLDLGSCPDADGLPGSTLVLASGARHVNAARIQS